VLVAVCGLLFAPGVARSDEPAARVWPLAGSREITRAFAPPEIRFAAGHRGVDLPSTPGAPVLATSAGRVSYSGLLAGRGVVVVSHGELRTTYEPVTASVEVGAVVAAGSVLGTLEPGHLGCPVAACLHWGLKRGADYLDPVRWVTGGPVRLLPLEGDLARAGAAALSDPALQSGPPQVGGLAPGGGPAQGSGREPATVPRDRPAPARLVDGGWPVEPGAVGSTPSAPLQARSSRPPGAASEPRWSLRSAEVPLGAAAVAALVAGIGLLARPRPPSPEPVSGGAATPVPVPVDADREGEVGPPGELVDLDAARLRRRSV
jgi:hypothetical protein